MTLGDLISWKCTMQGKNVNLMAVLGWDFGNSKLLPNFSVPWKNELYDFSSDTEFSVIFQETVEYIKV